MQGTFIPLARPLLAAIASAFLVACGSSLQTDQLDLNVPSPEWQDQIVYFILTDRFSDGDPTNDNQAPANSTRATTPNTVAEIFAGFSRKSPISRAWAQRRSG